MQSTLQLTSNAQILALRENQRISAYLKSRTNITTPVVTSLLITPVLAISDASLITQVYPLNIIPTTTSVCVCIWNDKIEKIER